ncbi:hypothetical protein TCDM_08120 [Trypanosoma cruzi Dm28c]|uniref:Uncharacterized protein n=1 Tax=Trypanosoma cruzi Dm28c TaxID=1416333 RepID=V5B8H5_TRYCR|nr:hypothetical protein TCDM_08120 [Trypanosoma cruzi Dm28c]
MFFAEYIGDAAPFLVDKVWSRLPEHVRRLTRRKLFLDLTDFLSLAVELHGWRIPYNLPNPVSSAMYASKYLFLRYTLMLDEPMLVEYAKCMSGATGFDALSSSSSPLKDLKGSELGAEASEVVLSPSLLDKRKKT